MKFLKKLWNDPVTSKLIANGIQAGFIALAWWIVPCLSSKHLIEAFIWFWTAKIEFWKFFLLLLFALVVFYVSFRR